MFGAGFLLSLKQALRLEVLNEHVQKSECYTVHRDAQTETKKQEEQILETARECPCV